MLDADKQAAINLFVSPAKFSPLSFIHTDYLVARRGAQRTSVDRRPTASLQELVHAGPSRRSGSRRVGTDQPGLQGVLQAPHPFPIRTAVCLVSVVHHLYR
jgi:hypothetical protein